jgi:hypothetical protein
MLIILGFETKNILNKCGDIKLGSHCIYKPFSGAVINAPIR